MMNGQRWPSIVMGWLGVVICLLGIKISAAKPDDSSTRQFTGFIAPLARLEPRLVEMLFLGRIFPYQAFLSSWVEKKMASTELLQADANQIFADYDVMAHHEPPLEWFYIGPCLVFSERLNRPDLCFSITGYGQKSVPTSWRIPLVQSFIEGVRLGRDERSRYFMQIAANKPEAPDEIRQMMSETEPVNLSYESLLRIIGESGAERYHLSKSTQAGQESF
jgi:hypothetical protein